MTKPTVDNNTTEPFGLDHKRFCFPSKLIAACPHCGEVITRDFSSDRGPYLSYPDLNEPFEVSMYHFVEDGEVEHEWRIKVRLTLTLLLEA